MTADQCGTSAIRHQHCAAEMPQRAWTVVLPRHPRAAAVARRSAGETLRWWGLDDVAEAALLVISELVSNAVLHARASGPSLELRLRAGSTRLRVEVHDTDARPPQLRRPAGLDEGGRGLLLVEAITDEWGVYGTPTGKAVWAALQLAR